MIGARLCRMKFSTRVVPPEMLRGCAARPVPFPRPAGPHSLPPSRRPSVRCTTTSAASARPAQPRTLRLAPRRGAAGKADTLDLSARIFTSDADKGPQRLAEMKRLVAQVRQRHHGAAGIMQAWRELTHAQINEIQAAHPPAEVRQSRRALLSHVRAQHQHGPDCNHDHDHGHGHDHVRLHWHDARRLTFGRSNISTRRWCRRCDR